VGRHARGPAGAKRPETETLKPGLASPPSVFEPEFSAVCDTCGATTTWHKANRVAEVDGQPSFLKGYKCAECETFETKVLDTEGEIRSRA
jgi:hypothetical protein